MPFQDFNFKIVSVLILVIFWWFSKFDTLDKFLLIRQILKTIYKIGGKIAMKEKIFGLKELQIYKETAVVSNME